MNSVKLVMAVITATINISAIAGDLFCQMRQQHGSMSEIIKVDVISNQRENKFYPISNIGEITVIEASEDGRRARQVLVFTPVIYSEAEGLITMGLDVHDMHTQKLIRRLRSDESHELIRDQHIRFEESLTAKSGDNEFTFEMICMSEGPISFSEESKGRQGRRRNQNPRREQSTSNNQSTSTTRTINR